MKSEEASTVPAIAERGIVVQGLRIATAMSDAPRALLARAPLVVLPAADHTWEDYRPILEQFAPERRVFALDWPGFGASARPSPADFAYSAERYTEVLTDWLNALGIARAVLVGNSIGGAAALCYAAAQPQRVAGLVLVSPGGFTPPSLMRTLACRVLGSPRILRQIEPSFVSFYLGPTTEATRAIVERHRAARATSDYDASITAYAALWRSFDTPAADLTELAGKVRAPAIVVRGALDPIISALDTRRAVAAIGERGALEVVLPEAGHLPFLQQPARFFQAVAGMLNTAEVNAAELS
ncbi:MAG: alpha/beta fold hydrolase [Ktedonobacterales bacterium]